MLNVRVKDAIIHEVSEEVKDIRNLNVFPAKRIKTPLGKSMCIASLLPTWRTSLAMAWAPLYTDSCYKSQESCG